MCVMNIMVLRNGKVYGENINEMLKDFTVYIKAIYKQ